MRKTNVFLLGALTGATGLALVDALIKQNPPLIIQHENTPTTSKPSDKTREQAVRNVANEPAPVPPASTPANSGTIEPVSAPEPAGRRSPTGRDFESEPRDPEWAYFMEQSIQQFLVNHDHGPKFQITSIECKTTMCDIQVVGYDESRWPDWTRIIHDLKEEQWNTFGMYGISGGSQENPLALSATLERDDR